MLKKKFFLEKHLTEESSFINYQYGGSGPGETIFNWLPGSGSVILNYESRSLQFIKDSNNIY
jgi:hypothetical protein